MVKIKNICDKLGLFIKLFFILVWLKLNLFLFNNLFLEFILLIIYCHNTNLFKNFNFYFAMVFIIKKDYNKY